MNHQSILVRSILSILCTLLACNAAWAQGQLEEIIVTAEFREANVQDTPLAITAVNSAMLEARSQTDLYQITAQAPNVTLNPAPVGSGPSMLAAIRGVGQTDFNLVMEPGVGIYIDDVYYPTLTGSLVDMLDLDRVEISRGPQGTLSGKNSIGGTIKLYSKKPGDAGGFFSTGFGSYNRMDLRGSADFEILDNLHARISGVSKHRDGYVKRLDYACANPGSGMPTYNLGDVTECVLGTEGGVAYNAGRVTLAWEPTDDISITVIGDLTNDASEAPANTLLNVNNPRNNPNLPNGGVGVNGYVINGVAQGTFFDMDGDIFTTTNDRIYYSTAFVPRDPYTSYATYHDPNPPLYPTNTNANALVPPVMPNRPYSPVSIPVLSDINQYGISGQLDWNINEDLKFTYIASWREFESNFTQDADASPINSQMLLQRLEHDQMSHEIRLNGSLYDSMFDYTIGGFYFEQDGIHEANVNLYYAQINFIHGPDSTPSTSKAVFGHGVVHLMDGRLNLTGGIRYTEDDKDYTHFRRNIDGTLPGPCPGPPPFQISYPPNCALAGLFNTQANFQSSRLDGRAALDYAFTDDIMGYYQYATGYKGGGINPRPFFLIQIESFQPETLTSHEFGFKSTLFDQRMRLNGAIFFNDYAEIQIQQSRCEVPFGPPGFLSAPCLQPGNVGNADVWGVEFETEIHPVDNLMIDAAVSYLDFEYTSVASTVDVTLNMVTPYTPEWKWSIGAQYTWDMGDLGSFTGRIDAAYQDDIYSSGLNSVHNLIDAYTLTNLRFTWNSADEDWEAALEILNLTDKLYYLNKFEQWGSSGTVTGAPGLPRTYGFTIKRNF